MPTELEGGVELRLALRKFAPDLAKATQKEMATAMRTVTSVAKGYVPSDGAMLSGWTKQISSEDINYRPFPKYSASEAKRGIGYSTTPSRPNKSGFRSLARIFNRSASGAIYETAGRVHPDGRPQKTVITVTKSYYSFQYTRSDTKKENLSLNPNAGKQFIDRLNSTGEMVNARPKGLVGRPGHKQKGRLIFRAWAQDNGRANAAVIKAIEKASALFYEHAGQQKRAA